MDLEGWKDAMARIAAGCTKAGAKRMTIVVAAFVDSDKRTVVQAPEIVRSAFASSSYRLIRVCYASKRIQASRRDRIAFLNHAAKRDRLPQGDICEVLTFEPVG
jgi:hypothetical protein